MAVQETHLAAGFFPVPPHTTEVFSRSVVKQFALPLNFLLMIFLFITIYNLLIDSIDF